jgi:hypothetical protein
MFKLSRTIPVNDDPAEPALTRADLWAGLVMKAGNALPFVPQMKKCDVVERQDGWLVRDIVISGDVELREKVTFEPGYRVVFERIGGSEPGRIENSIQEDDAGNLSLTFAFALSKAGLADGSEAERAHFAPMEGAYFGAVASTLAAVRRTVKERGRDTLATAYDPNFSGNPQWIFEYYAAADTLDVDRLLALHTNETTCRFANLPTMQGKAAVRQALTGMWSTFKAMSHAFTGAWSIDGGRTGLAESVVTYVRHDDTQHVVRSCSVLRRAGSLVDDARVHVDLSGL